MVNAPMLVVIPEMFSMYNFIKKTKDRFDAGLIQSDE